MKNTLLMLLMLGVAPSALHAETLDVGIIGDVKSTEFATKHDDNTMMLLHQILEGLVTYDDKLEVAPQLAKSWDVSEDGRVYTFHLRPGVKFHNGQPLTSREVQWNWSRFLDSRSTCGQLT
jgi:peptide/nickel transport system substrate-binding protein